MSDHPTVIDYEEGTWLAEPTRLSQDAGKLPVWSQHVTAGGCRGQYAGVLVGDDHLSVNTARKFAAALLRHADIAEAQAVVR
ncbi:hypothetical protein GO011_17240 [Mycobacterium sp. 20091114027_K0903767]|nr:hypothetical protein [Mycobacterium sp. 20091114027_K0903767]